MAFGLKRKTKLVKTGNLSTQAVATAESERISKLLKKSKNKKGIRAKKAKKKANRLINQQRQNESLASTSSVSTQTTQVQQERKPLEPIRLYSAAQPTITISSPSQPTDASTTNTSNSSVAKTANLRYSSDILDISETTIVNDQFEPVEKYGITSLRPEIISVSNFIPLFYEDNSTFTDGGKFLSLQYQMLNVRNETLARILDSMDSWNSQKTQATIENVKSDFEKQVAKIHKSIEHFDKFINVLENTKEGLNIKNVRHSIGFNVLSIESFFEKVLQYSKQKQKYFSNSKMYLQMCLDLRSVLENYSFDLLKLTDSDRTNDFDPINIDNTYTTRDGFTFSIDSIRSITTPENASSSELFTKTINSLPQELNDRIKLLITLLSKEYRVSKNLGRSSVASVLSDKFSQADSGNPFDNIVGIPGDTIFDNPVGDGSLSSLAYLPISNNSVVLPFESKHIDATTKGKTYIPGSSYFLDVILAGANNNKFNTKPFVDYVDLATQTISDSTSAINSLLELTSQEQSRLSPRVMASSFLESVKSSIEGIVLSKSINKNQATSVALLRLANSDTKLKNMLFQFVIFSGIATQTNENNKAVFSRLARELKSSTAISYARIVANLAIDLTDTKKLGVLKSYLQVLAQDIEDRVFFLVSDREIPNRSVSQTANQQQLLESDNNFLSLDILGNVDFNPDRRIVFLNEGDIKTILMSLMTPSTVANTTMFSEFQNMASELSFAASSGGSEDFLLPDHSGRTRYNFVSTSMQLLLIFEIISSFSNKYTFAEFSKTKYKNKLALDVDTKSNNFVVKKISELLGLPSVENEGATVEQAVQARSVQNFADSWNAMVEFAKTGIMPQQQGSVTTISGITQTTSQAIVREQTPFGPEHDELLLGIQNILTKVSKENQVIKDFLLLFNQFGNQIANAKSVVLNTFNSETSSRFFEEDFIDFDMVRNPTQLRLSSYILSEYVNASSQTTEDTKRTEQNNYGSIILNDIPSEQQLRTMFALLKEPLYGFSAQADERLRIISVGVPAGFTSKLSDRLDITKIQKESFLQRQSDIIKINVYKKDARFEDIVFKPKSFIFDISLFQTKNLLSDIEPRDGESFSLLSNRFQLTDFDNPKYKKVVSVDSIKNNSSYSFLSNQQKQQLVANHVQSSLLEIYIELMSGMKLREKTFTVDTQNPGTATNESLVALLRDYVENTYEENLGNTTIQELLRSENLDIGIQDIIKLFAYGNKMFEPQIIKQETLSPKLFDRIFHIPVSTEGFELDLELTRRTESGRKALLQNFVQQRIIESSNGTLIFSNQSPEEAQTDVVFADFFITIETDF